ncbi:MAG: DUF929 domain-containing protein [Candidatus Thermoplasmatota archaeon]|nr:DUF929 domain-containing protein [Candidatus Thermoplasmatota archaeon]MCL5881527.1 DUF929 domain-containing protein [Candidatus Thermoplasmatota archaeon]
MSRYHNRKMANRASKPEPKEKRGRDRRFAVIGAVLVVIIFVLLSFHFGLLKLPNGNAIAGSKLIYPSYIEIGEFAKVSDSNLGKANSVNVYFLSWKGCPIGAAESWVIYSFIHSNGIASGNSYITDNNHTSDPNDSFANTPGLLFTNFTSYFSDQKFQFHVAYVYGEYINMSLSQAISSGSNVLNRSFPASISSVFYSFQTGVPLGTSPGALPSAIANKHLTTSIIITGNNGTYLLEGALFSPGVLSGYTPSQVMATISDNSSSAPFTSTIGNGTAYFEKAVGYAMS